MRASETLKPALFLLLGGQIALGFGWVGAAASGEAGWLILVVPGAIATVIGMIAMAVAFYRVIVRFDDLCDAHTPSRPPAE